MRPGLGENADPNREKKKKKSHNQSRMLLFNAQGFSSPKTLGKIHNRRKSITAHTGVLSPNAGFVQAFLTHRLISVLSSCSVIPKRRLHTGTESEWDFRWQQSARTASSINHANHGEQRKATIAVSIAERKRQGIPKRMGSKAKLEESPQDTKRLILRSTPKIAVANAQQQ
jgi:hypothetical protein